MDKKTYILPIITSSILLTLLAPTLFYIILPLAIIMIYAINVYCNKLAVGTDAELTQELDENTPKKRILQP